MRVLFIAVIATGCGRIAFDPIGGAPGDGNTSTDGAMTGDSITDASTVMLPGGGETCLGATALAFGTGGSASIANATDDFDPLLPGCVDGPEIVYRVVAATSGNRSVMMSPSFNASLIITRGCPPPGGACQSVIAGQSYSGAPFFQSGENFIIIEKTGGAGTGFTLTL